MQINIGNIIKSLLLLIIFFAITSWHARTNYSMNDDKKTMIINGSTVSSKIMLKETLQK